VQSVSGHKQQAGAVSEDPNVALRGQGWVRTVEQMMLDARLFGAMRALVQTLLSARLRWVPPAGVESPLAQECADHLNDMFGFAGRTGTMRKPFERQLETMLKFVALGWRYFEVDYQRQPDGSWGIAEFLDCKPSAHYQWLPLDGSGPFEGVRQLDPNGSTSAIGREVVPADKLLLLTLNQEGDNPEGFGLFRPCFFWWATKSHTGEQMGIGVERVATGIPSAEFDREELHRQGFEDAQIDGEGAEVGLLDDVRDTIASMAAGEDGQVVYPKGITFNVLYNDAFDPQKLRSVIDLANEELLTVFLNSFLMLGLSSSGGSYALGKTQKDLFTETALNILQQVTQAIGGPAGPGTGPVGRILDWHPRFSALPQSERPRIDISGLDVAPFMDFVQAASGLAAEGILTRTNAFERWMLAKVGAPDLSSEHERTPDERAVKDAVQASLMKNRTL
jgi:hypothetical protein